LVASVNLTLFLSYGFAADLFPSIEIPVFHNGYQIKKEYEMVNEKWRDELAVKCQLQPNAGKKEANT
jgi:hypothetical protein